LGIQIRQKTPKIKSPIKDSALVIVDTDDNVVDGRYRRCRLDHILPICSKGQYPNH